MVLQPGPSLQAGPKGSVRPSILAGTTLIRASLVAVTPPEAFEIADLVPAGACPGHYDLTPSQSLAMRTAGLVLLHGFQQGMAMEKRAPGIPVVYLPDAPTLLTLSAWEKVLDATAEAVGEVWPELRGKVQSRLKAAKTRAAASVKLAKGLKPLFQGRPALVASMQEAFVRSLGFKVIGVVPREEDLVPAAWVSLRKQKPALVVANLQEGVKTASELAGKLGVPLVVLFNFPGVEGCGDTWESLLEYNLKRLKIACAK